jgi:hypothetical protein
MSILGEPSFRQFGGLFAHDETAGVHRGVSVVGGEPTYCFLSSVNEVPEVMRVLDVRQDIGELFVDRDRD